MGCGGSGCGGATSKFGTILNKRRRDFNDVLIVSDIGDGNEVIIDLVKFRVGHVVSVLIIKYHGIVFLRTVKHGY